MPDEVDATNQNGNQQQTSVSTKSQLVNVKLHLDAEPQNIRSAHSDSEISTHERDEELPDREVHSDSDAKGPNRESRTKRRLAKYVRKHHPTEQIIGDKDVGPMTRNRLRSETFFLSKVEPKIVSEALQDDDWYNVMKEEIKKIEKNKTWTLVLRLPDKNVIGTKWVFRNKLDENGEIIRNKARLVYKGYAQEE